MSNKIERIGLFLGKFSILHAGHQFVIDTALKEMDKLIILIYDAPSLTDIPLDIRAGWIEKIYANSPVEVIRGWCGSEDTGYSDEVKKIQNEYILKMVGDKRVTHFYSSEPYGEHVSEALNCVNRELLTRSVKPFLLRPLPFRKSHTYIKNTYTHWYMWI